MNTASGRQIFATTAGALALAAIVLVAVVLPAELGVDPLGTGARLGLLGLSAPPAAALEGADGPWATHEIEFALAPFESVEYKYHLDRGAALVFSWTSTGTVVYDMHAHQDTDPPAGAQSFAAGRADAGSGSYVAPFAGVHGWFWENRGLEDVSVRLRAAGFFTAGTEYHDGWSRDHVLTPGPSR